MSITFTSQNGSKQILTAFFAWGDSKGVHGVPEGRNKVLNQTEGSIERIKLGTKQADKNADNKNCTDESKRWGLFLGNETMQTAGASRRMHGNRISWKHFECTRR